jgi:hypothetical protein
MTGPAILAFWEFGSPVMLAWAVAAAIPIVLHLLSRRTRESTPWAAMRFLQAALRKNARRLQLEQLLLLALRASLLFLLAIALAEPMLSLPRVGAVTGSRGRRYTIMVLDGSYSMGYKTDGRPRFEMARERAQQLVNQSVQGDGFSVVLMADPPRAIIGDVAFDPDDVRQEIDELQPTHGSAPLVDTLNEVDRILQAGASRHPRLVQHQVCFFTDLDRTTWDAATSEDARRRLIALAERANVVVVDVGDATRDNVAVVNLSADRPLPLRGDEVTLEVELRNFGSQEVERRLSVEIDGRSVWEDQLAIPAGGSAGSSFAFRFELPGEHLVEARIDPDALEIDDRRWLSLPVREQVRVLCVQGKPEAAKYLAVALSPGDAVRTPIVPEVVAENALLERELGDYDCVWLCNVGRIDREEIRQLYRYAARGAGIVVSLGDQVQPDNYNRELAGEASGLRILPAGLGPLVGETLQRLDTLNYQHPAIAAFRGHERAGLLTVPTWRYFQLTPLESADAQEILAFRNGDPAIIEARVGQGRCVLVATSISLASRGRDASSSAVWSALPTWPSFPPLMHGLLLYAVRGRAPLRNALVGESLTSRLADGGGDSVVVVSTPDDRTERVPVRVQGTDRQWMYGPTEWSGIYRVSAGSPNQSQENFAVNVDTGESDVARTSRAELPPQIKDQVIHHSGTRALASDNDWPLFRVVLSVLLLTLFLETIVAYRFGGERVMG